MAGWTILIIVVLIVLWAIGAYNSLVSKRQEVRTAWSQIDVQLKRRHDLIPNLVEAVKGFMQHEKETLERVIQARNQAVNVSADDLAKKAAAENLLTQTLRSLFAVSERSPDIKANQNVLELQEELTSTENKISYARQFYNEQSRRLNTAIETIPVNLVAQLAHFTKEAYFEPGTVE